MLGWQDGVVIHVSREAFLGTSCVHSSVFWAGTVGQIDPFLVGAGVGVGWRLVFCDSVSCLKPDVVKTVERVRQVEGSSLEDRTASLLMMGQQSSTE